MFCGDGVHHIVSHQQQVRTMVPTQRLRYLHLRPCAFAAFVGYTPAVSPLRSPHRFHQQGGKSHFRTPILLIRSNRKSTSILPQHQLTPASDMATVDTVAQTRFWDSFSASTEDTREGLSVGRATASDGHWTKWAYFCARMDLDPCLSLIKTLYPSSTPSIGTTGQGTFR